jgi:D-sedoheptulose 7-phosphate isomerase
MTIDELKKQGRGGGDVTFDFQSFAESYIEDLRRTLSEMPIEELEKLHREVDSAIRNDSTIHFIGNGGSAATPSHSAGDWSKELRVRTLCHVDNVASLTAFANDVSYDEVFVGQLGTFLRPGDLVIGFSGSGNSENVLRGLEFAKDKGCKTAAVTGDYNGGNGGKLPSIVDVCLIAPTTSMERIEDVQLIVNHIIKEAIKESRATSNE